MDISNIQSFLKDLSENNNREWFAANKSRYEACKVDFEEISKLLIMEIAAFDSEIRTVDVRDCVFRIYRDTRFSKDKSPYKTNFGASLGMGKGSQKAGYYLHIEPGKSFLGGGIYMPESSALKAIRKEISAFGDEFKAILEKDDFRNYFRGLSVEDKLKNVPQGFEKDDKMAEFLKLKHFIVTHPVSDEQLLSKNAPKEIAKVYHAMKPLVDFLNAI